MKKAIELAAEYARSVPDDIHVPTLAKMIENKEVEAKLGEKIKPIRN